MCNVLFYRCLLFLKIVKIKKIAADLNKKNQEADETVSWF